MVIYLSVLGHFRELERQVPNQCSIESVLRSWRLRIEFVKKPRSE